MRFGEIMEQPVEKDLSINSKLSVFLKLMVLLFVFNLIVERGLQLLPVYTLGDNFHLTNTIALSRRLPFFWTGLIAPLVYLRALWIAANFLNKYQQTRRFDHDLFADLRRCGTYLMYATISVILLVPSLEGWLNQGLHHIKWEWNINAVCVGLIGMVLKFVAQSAQLEQRANNSSAEK